jgi:hypothetical protein
MEIEQKQTNIKDLLNLNIEEIIIPLKYLPSRIHMPKKFLTIKITVAKPTTLRNPEFYFLLSKNVFIDIEKKILYYRTRFNRYYSIPIEQDDLPKELKKYTRGLHLYIAKDPKDGTVGVILLPTTDELLTLQGIDINDINEKFLVSLLFLIYDKILMYLRQ